MKEGDSQRYRSQIRIYYDILRALDNDPEVKITHLIHQVNLPYDRLKEYLRLMNKRGLIEIPENEEQRIAVTEKGKRFLSEYHQMERWALAFGIEL